MRRTRHVVLPVKSWQYVGLLLVSLACLTLGLVSRDRGGRSESLAGPELKHTAPHEVDACPNSHPFNRLPPHDDSAYEKGINDYSSYTPTVLDRFPEKSPSTLEGREKAVRDSRAGLADRRIRTVDRSRTGVDSFKDRTSTTLRILSRGERANSRSREGRSNIRFAMADRSAYRRSGTTDRETHRRLNRNLNSFADRSSRSGSAELRDESSMKIGKVNRQRESSIASRRQRAVSIPRNAYSERQRLISQSYDVKREDRVARNLFRVTDTDRRDGSFAVPRRSVRSVKARDIRDDRSSRLSRSRDNRERRNGQNRRSDERLRTTAPEDRLREHRPVDIRRSTATRLQERSISAERRDTNQREHRDRQIARSVTSRMDTRRSRSADSNRIDTRIFAMRSQEVRAENRERDSRERRSGRTSFPSRSTQRQEGLSARIPGTVRSGVQHKSDNMLAGSHIVRASSRRSTDRRIDIERMSVRSEERMTRGGYPDIRRVESRSRQARADLNRHDESSSRKIDRSTARRVRVERESRSASASPMRRSLERNEMRRSVRQRNTRTETARTEDHRAAGWVVMGQRTWADSLRRDVRGIRDSRPREQSVRRERLTARDVSQERRNSAISERPHRLMTPDASAGRREASIERTREHRTSSSEDYRKSKARMEAQVRSETLQDRTRRNTRLSKSLDTERSQRLGTREVSARRTELFRNSRAIARTRDTSTDIKRETSITRRLERTSGKNTVRRDIRSYEITRNTERRAYPVRAVPQDRRNDRSTDRSIRRELHGRLAGAAITRELRVSRGQNATGAGRARNTMDNDIRDTRDSRNRQIVNDHYTIDFPIIPDFENLREMSKTASSEHLRQTFVLVLCTVYGASLLRGKGGFYGFRNFVTPMTRFVAW